MKLHILLIAAVVMAALVACSRTETPKEDSASFEELSEQGRALCRKGNYVEGMTLLLEAKDSLARMHPDSVNPTGVIKLLGNISNMYQRMGLYEEAIQTNSEAMEIADAKAVQYLSDLWRMRSVMYGYTEQYDSMMICLRRSVEVCARIKDEKKRSKRELHNRRHMLYAYIEYPDFAPDSVPMALAALERINSNDPMDMFSIGRAKAIIGDYKNGIPLMEKSLETFRQMDDTETVEWGLQLLAKFYAEAGDRKLFDIYNEAAALHDSIMQGRSDNILLGMDFRYRTSQLENEKAILVGELKTKQQRIIFICIISVIFTGAVICFYIMRSRNNKRQLKLKQQNIDTLLTERIALNTRIEELNRTMASKTEDPEQIGILQSILLEKEDEQRFRKSFNDLHPDFIYRLRKDCPGLTSGNELMCMLIALRRSNDEIALSLGISRESVATSRYRLRSRFNLPKEIDLNDFIISKL